MKLRIIILLLIISPLITIQTSNKEVKYKIVKKIISYRERLFQTMNIINILNKVDELYILTSKECLGNLPKNLHLFTIKLLPKNKLIKDQENNNAQDNKTINALDINLFLMLMGKRLTNRSVISLLQESSYPVLVRINRNTMLRNKIDIEVLENITTEYDIDNIVNNVEALKSYYTKNSISYNNLLTSKSKFYRFYKNTNQNDNNHSFGLKRNNDISDFNDISLSVLINSELFFADRMFFVIILFILAFRVFISF